MQDELDRLSHHFSAAAKDLISEVQFSRRTTAALAPGELSLPSSADTTGTGSLRSGITGTAQIQISSGAPHAPKHSFSTREMSDEAGPSRARQTSLGGDPLQSNGGVEEDGARESGQMELSERDIRYREEFKRLKLLDDLENQLDSLILVELAIVYYLDCSFIRLILRGLTQFCYLTPLPLIFPERPERQPYVSAIIGSNIVCMLFHLWNPRPSAGEALRGYLHGGSAMDFIGTKGPVSKIHLILLDFFVLALQLVLLSANVKRRVSKDRLKQSVPSRSNDQSDAAPVASPTNLNPSQDIDAEEQGLLRRSMSISSAYGTQSNSQTQASADEHDAQQPSSALLDALVSGQVVIAELRVADTVRDQFRLYQSRYSASSPSDLATQLAGRSVHLTTRFRFNPG